MLRFERSIVKEIEIDFNLCVVTSFSSNLSLSSRDLFHLSVSLLRVKEAPDVRHLERNGTPGYRQATGAMVMAFSIGSNMYGARAC